MLKNSCFKSFLTLKCEHSDKGRSLKVLRKLFQSAMQLYLLDCVPYLLGLSRGVSSSLLVVDLVVSSGYFFYFFTLLGLVFQVLKVPLKKICKIEPPDLLFLVAFIILYISRKSFHIICKKDFRHDFSFLTDSLKPPTPLTAKIL